MSFVQLIEPNPHAKDVAGACLRQVQRVFQNRQTILYRSAFHAWTYAQYKHYDRNFPEGVAVILHFNHWGRYDDGLGQYGTNPWDPYYGNWGHIVTRFPNGAILSSPAYVQPGNKESNSWFTSIEQVENMFGGAYLGWTEDVGGARVVEPVVVEEEETMTVQYITFHTVGRKSKQVINNTKGNQPLKVYVQHQEGKVAIDGGAGDNIITAELRVTGTANTQLRVTANRYIWDAKAGKFKGHTYLNSTDLKLDSRGAGAISFPIQNRVPLGERVGVELTVPVGQKVVIDRFAAKGYHIS